MFERNYLTRIYLKDILRIMKTNVKKLKCLRCGWSWYPRIPDVIICPRCKSPYWNRPRKNKKVK
jgi:predicted Zn-ribbon and HTH transcriptional regulator